MRSVRPGLSGGLQRSHGRILIAIVLHVLSAASPLHLRTQGNLETRSSLHASPRADPRAPRHPRHSIPTSANSTRCSTSGHDASWSQTSTTPWCVSSKPAAGPRAVDVARGGRHKVLTYGWARCMPPRTRDSLRGAPRLAEHARSPELPTDASSLDRRGPRASMKLSYMLVSSPSAGGP